jgi:O-antigen/teichoic acid export membrane protein
MGWVLAGHVLSLLASLLSTKVLAQVLGAREYGRLALGMTIPMLLNQLVYGPLGAAVARHYAPLREAGQLRSLLAVLYPWLSRLTGSLLAAGAVAGLAVGALAGRAWAWLFLAALAFGLLLSLQGVFNVMQAAGRRRASAAMHQALVPLSRLASGLVAVVIFRDAAEVAVTAFAVGMGFVLWSQWHWFERALPPGMPARPEDLPAIRSVLWAYARYFVLWGAFSWSQVASDSWSLKLFHDDAVVGLYAVAFQMASVPGTLVTGALTQFVVPIAFQRAGPGLDRRRLESSGRITRFVVVAMGAWTAALAAASIWAGEPLLVLATSEEYRTAARSLPLLIVALGLMQIGHVWGLVPMAHNALGVHTALRIGHSLATTGLNLLGARFGGIPGVSLSLVLSGVAYVSAMAWNAERVGRQAPAGAED